MRSLLKALRLRINRLQLRCYLALFGPELVCGDINRWAFKVGMEEVLRMLGAEVGEQSRIDPPLFIKNAEGGSCRNLKIGRHVRTGPGLFFDLAASIVIEDEVGIADGTIIVTHFGVGDRPLQRVVGYSKGGVTFKRGCYVGVGCIILHGVTHGEYSITGAGTLVREDVPPRSVCVGVPGKVIKTFDFDPDAPSEPARAAAAS